MKFSGRFLARGGFVERLLRLLDPASPGAPFSLARRRNSGILAGKIDAGALTEFEGLNPLFKPLDSHFEAEPIIVAVSRFGDGGHDIGRAVTGDRTHEIVSELNAAVLN